MMNSPASPFDPPANPLDVVLAEYVRRRDAGMAVDIESFCAEHPAIAAELRQYVAAERFLESLAAAASTEEPPSVLGITETVASSPAMPWQHGRFSLGFQFGRYRIVNLLGEGGMGSVFLADDILLGRQIALKIPKHSGREGSEFPHRFTREAQAAARLSHPNICRIYDAGTIDGVPFISMEYIAGRPLSRFIAHDRLRDQRFAADIVRQIALGLAHAHHHGVLHRDLKAGNVLLRNNQIPCLTDFGLARLVETSQQSPLTQEGAIIGTPAYMAPEQIESTNESIGPAVDTYALGVLFYEWLTGQLPFQGSIISILGQKLHGQPTPLSELRPDASPRLESLCMAMLQKRPEIRPASMLAIAAELNDWLASADDREQRSHCAAAQNKLPRSQKAAQSPAPAAPKTANQKKFWIRGATALAACLAAWGTIMITIRSRDGQESTVRVNQGVRVNLDLPPESKVTIRAEPPPPPNPQPIRADRSVHPEAEMTEEELFPSLEKWLQGRKQFTVAQDGSAMFTTIQSAIDAMNPGDVVVVQDKGPYAESLVVRDQTDSGIVSPRGTIIDAKYWYHNHPETPWRSAFFIQGSHGFRIHGLTIVSDPQEERDLYPLVIHASLGVCCENSVFLPKNSDPIASSSLLTAIAEYAPPYNLIPSGNCMRDCVIAVSLAWPRTRPGEVDYAFRNWFYLIDRPQTIVGIDIPNDSSTTPSRFQHNIIDMSNVDPNNGTIGINGKADHPRIDIKHNTALGEPGCLFFCKVNPRNTINITDGLFLVTRPFIRLSSFEHEVSINLERNYVVVDNSWENDIAKLYVATDSPQPIRVLSNDPFDRNFLRVDPATITVPDGNPFPGALPPGPPPPEGDWFTRLQDRWRDALPYVSEENRQRWTRPIDSLTQ